VDDSYSELIEYWASLLIDAVLVDVEVDVDIDVEVGVDIDVDVEVDVDVDVVVVGFKHRLSGSVSYLHPEQ
jgi:hypothetical protein